MELLRKASPRKGFQTLVCPECADLKYLSLGQLLLAAGESFGQSTAGIETALVVLSGQVTLSADDTRFEKVGSRATVFDGPATALYVPLGSAWRAEAHTACEVLACSAPATNRHPVQFVSPAEVGVREVGRGNWTRHVHDLMLDNIQADHLILGETFNPPGNWSSYPPHKHDFENPPDEVKLEEVYHYRLNPSQGFGLQRIYTDDRSLDATFCVEEGDTMVIPKGYHPVSAAGGYELYYFWVLAGEGRVMRPKDDPAHTWVKEAGA